MALVLIFGEAKSSHLYIVFCRLEPIAIRTRLACASRAHYLRDFA